MVDIARGMGMKTIAEFVEAEETVAMLREKGVDYSQGYYHGAPRPVATEFARIGGAPMSGPGRPGSGGEHDLQERYGTVKRANAFYDNQVLDYLTPEMREFILRMKMAFIATSDAHGECDNSFRAGPPGFMRVLDEKTVMWPEYKGNGVMASMGNIMENPYVGHPDGRLLRDRRRPARQRHGDDRRERTRSRPSAGSSTGSRSRPPFAESPSVKKTPERWVVVAIEEAYVHCSKHIPMLHYLDGEEPEAEVGRRAGDVFKAKNGERAWLQPAACEVEPESTPSPRVAEAPPEIGTVRFAQPLPAAAPHAASRSGNVAPQQRGRQACRSPVALELRSLPS